MTDKRLPKDVDNRWHSTEVGRGEPSYEAVAFAVSAVVNEPVETLDPLYEVVDPHALDRLLKHANAREVDITATFEYCGCQVRISNEHLSVRPLEPLDE